MIHQQVHMEVCEKDIAVYIDKKLHYNKHVASAVNKTNSKLGISCRSFKNFDGYILVQLHERIIS